MTTNDFFVKELQHAREHAGRTQQDVADLVPGVSRSALANWEAGRRRIPPKIVEQLDALYGAAGYLIRLQAHVGNLVTPDWLDPWIKAEETALAINGLELSLIPGLLQTQAYAESVLGDPTYHGADVAELVDTRMERQKILERLDVPPNFTAIIPEAVLTQGVIGPGGMYEQMTRLLRVSASEVVTILVLPHDAPTRWLQVAPFAIALPRPW